MRLGERLMLSGWGRGLGTGLGERLMLSGWGEGPRNEARRMVHAIRLGGGA